VKPSDRRKLAKALLKDLIRELKDIKPVDELARLADRLVEESIVPEINRPVGSQ